MLELAILSNHHPCLWISFGLHRDYHRPSDDVSHIDFNHMKEAIHSMLGPVKWLANSKFKPEWVEGKKP